MLLSNVKINEKHDKDSWILPDKDSWILCNLHKSLDASQKLYIQILSLLNEKKPFRWLVSENPLKETME